MYLYLHEVNGSSKNPHSLQQREPRWTLPERHNGDIVDEQNKADSIPHLYYWQQRAQHDNKRLF